ncbi:hypothetical protein VTK73DRAFT_2512 [Phialemonium thermophilum]|uniref:Heterokaryon incompatibility domain-containing protein n=1 Tax=Phialemonium thermophilum TaxID=223376 RepID=A0ABR3X4D8_9PEZI
MTGPNNQSLPVEPLDIRMDVSGNQRLCRSCTPFDPQLYLGSLFLQRSEVRQFRYPWAEKSVDDMAKERSCSLCRLVLRVFEQTEDPVRRATLQYMPSAYHLQPSQQPILRAEGPIWRSILNVVNLEIWADDKRVGVVHMSAQTSDNFLEPEIRAVPDGRLGSSSLPVPDCSVRTLFPHFKPSLMKARRTEPMVSAELLNVWVEQCRTHSARCRPEIIRPALRPAVRMIDVQKRKVVHPFRTSEADPRFAALSYVWGQGVKQLKNTREGGLHRLLEQDEFLSDGNTDVPTTIRDALILCQRLRIPYLWVDALCLDQDGVRSGGTSDSMSHDPFSTMGEIYASAWVTIVAAHGEDSWAGLPGIVSPRPESYITEPLSEDGGRRLLICRKALADCVRDTVWSRRAWTFQEMVLSKRLLVFTDTEVFFECDSRAAYRETVEAGLSDLSGHVTCKEMIHTGFKQRMGIVWSGDHDDEGPQLNSGELHNLTHSRYIELVTAYLGRKATLPADVLRAFEGITSRLRATISAKTFYGIMLPHLARDIIFQVSPAKPSYYREGFPTWSWCGWHREGQARVVLASHYTTSLFTCLPTFFRLDPEYGLDSFDKGNRRFVPIEDFAGVLPRETLELRDYKEDWRERLHIMLAFRSEVLRTRLEIRRHPHNAEEKVYHVVKPRLGIETICLPGQWAEQQVDSVEFVMLGRIASDNVWKGDKFWGWVTSPVRPGMPNEMLVFCALIWTDELGISQRLGLQVVEAHLWERAKPIERIVYLC